MKALRKPLSLFMALLMCLGVFVGTGTTAFAAGETMTTYMIDLPRASDPNKAGWGHPALNFMGGWSTGENDSFSVHTQDAFNGRAIYCIEPGIGVNTGDREVVLGENPQDETGMKYMCAFCQQNALFAESCRLESRNNMIISIKRDDCAVLIGAKEALCL